MADQTLNFTQDNDLINNQQQIPVSTNPSSQTSSQIPNTDDPLTTGNIIPQDLAQPLDELNKNMENLKDEAKDGLSQAENNSQNDQAAAARAAKLRTIAENINNLNVNTPNPQQNINQFQPISNLNTPITDDLPVNPNLTQVSSSIPDNFTKTNPNYFVDPQVLEALGILINSDQINQELKEQLKIEQLRLKPDNQPIIPQVPIQNIAVNQQVNPNQYNDLDSDEIPVVQSVVNPIASSDNVKSVNFKEEIADNEKHQNNLQALLPEEPR